MTTLHCARCFTILAMGLAASLSCHGADGDGQHAGNWYLAGYSKTLGIASEAFDQSRQPYTLWLNRTRLKGSYRVAGRLELHAENDTELRLGDYLRTGQSRGDSLAPQRGYWNLRTVYSDGQHRRVTNDFFRAFAKLSMGDTDMTGGRQRIALGTGRLWSTLDMLNPLNPLQIERDEYVGVDALMLEHRLASLSKLTAVYAPQPNGGPPRWVASYRAHVGGADVGITAARYFGDKLLGVDVVTQIGGLGLRAEMTQTRPLAGSRHASATLGVDYAFENSLTLSLESYLSTQPLSQRRAQFAAQPLRTFVQPADTRYLGVVGSYEFTPLVKLTVVVLSNLRDNSRFCSASIAWSLTDNVVVQAGLQRFSANPGSEYGRGRPLNYVQLQAFF